MGIGVQIYRKPYRRLEQQHQDTKILSTWLLTLHAVQFISRSIIIHIVLMVK